MLRLIPLLFVGFIALVATPPRAEACTGTGCQVLLASIGPLAAGPSRHQRLRRSEPAFTRKTALPSLAKLAEATARIVKTQPQRPRVAPASAEAEVRANDLAKLEPRTPEIWLQFRDYAYAHLPNHDHENFHAVWVAMPVATPDETVAGVGLKGTWW